MKKTRGIIALVIAIALGFIAVKAVSFYLKKPAPKKTAAIIKKEKPKPDLFANLSEGMRVITIKVDDVSGVSRKLKKGDIVDVVSTTSLSGAKSGRISRIILKRVNVFSVAGGHVDMTKRLVTQKKSWTVSLLTERENAAMLTAAAKESDITLMLCNRPEKIEQAEEDGDASYIFTGNQGPQKFDSTDINFSKSIPLGMRAVSVKVQETDGVCGIIKPGDCVDVIVSCTVSKVAGKDMTPGEKGTYTEYRMHSRILLQNIKVLATENSIKPGGNSSEPVKLATLLVTLQDALVLSTAADTSKKTVIKLINRKINDSDIPKTETVYLSELMTQRKAYRNKVYVLKGVKLEVFPF